MTLSKVPESFDSDSERVVLPASDDELVFADFEVFEDFE